MQTKVLRVEVVGFTRVGEERLGLKEVQLGLLNLERSTEQSWQMDQEYGSEDTMDNIVDRVDNREIIIITDNDNQLDNITGEFESFQYFDTLIKCIYILLEKYFPT